MNIAEEEQEPPVHSAKTRLPFFLLLIRSEECWGQRAPSDTSFRIASAFSEISSLCRTISYSIFVRLALNSSFLSRLSLPNASKYSLLNPIETPHPLSAYPRHWLSRSASSERQKPVAPTNEMTESKLGNSISLYEGDRPLSAQYLENTSRIHFPSIESFDREKSDAHISLFETIEIMTSFE